MSVSCVKGQQTAPRAEKQEEDLLQARQDPPLCQKARANSAPQRQKLLMTELRRLDAVVLAA